MGFGTVFDNFDADHSFAEAEQDVHWIAHEILHRTVYPWCPDKRMDRRCRGYNQVNMDFSAVFDNFDGDHSFAGGGVDFH